MKNIKLIDNYNEDLIAEKIKIIKKLTEDILITKVRNLVDEFTKQNYDKKTIREKINLIVNEWMGAFDEPKLYNYKQRSRDVYRELRRSSSIDTDKKDNELN